MTILIRQAEIIDPHSPYDGHIKNILIEKGIIRAISDTFKASTASITKVIEAKGLKISPGWFDMRVSIGDPGIEHKEDLRSGSEAAMQGGFTGIAMLPNTKPAIQTKDTISYIKNTSKNFLVDFFPLAAVTLNMAGEELTEMMDLHKAGAIAFTDGNNSISHSGLLTRALQYVQPINGLIIQHAEEKKLTIHGQMNEGVTSTYLGLKGLPHLAEELIIARDIELLEYVGGKIHFSHISGKKSVDIIRQAKKRGLQITCDVAVPNLVFDDKVLSDFDTNYKVNPPLRLTDDIKALWEGIADDTIDAIVSDHSPHDSESKHLEFDQAEFGMIGLETAFAALNTFRPNNIPLLTIIKKLTTGPRTVLGLQVDKIVEEAPANLTLFSETTEWTFTTANIKSKSKNSPFIGKELTGKAIAVFNKEQFRLIAN